MHRAASLFETFGDLHGSLQAQSGHAMVLQDSGRPEEALVSYQDTLAFLERVGDRLEPHIADFSQGEVTSGMGICCVLMERWTEAVDHFSTAAAISRQSGNAALESRHLVHLGEALLSAGRPEEARKAFDRCVSLGLDADPQRVARARDLLARLDAG
jgi:tetratricopeptide (TPR) repeat protein